jgi:hypothetical protein
MRNVSIPALMVALACMFCTNDASAFGLLDKMCGKSACDSGCAEPVCGCEVIVEPACGCEVAAPVCDAPCGKRKLGLLHKLFHKHNHGCDAGPACGCEVIAEPVCGCEVIAEPACGCEIAVPACGCDVVGPCSKPSCGAKVKGLLGKLFHKHNRGCDVGPTCGCEVAVGPSCGTDAGCGCY